MPFANKQGKCPGCSGQILIGEEIERTSKGWSHSSCAVGLYEGTYLAEIEDSEGHPLAMRVPVGVTPEARPRCRHAHSIMCTHEENAPYSPVNTE